MTQRQVAIDAAAVGVRLDLFLARHLTAIAADDGISRAMIQRCIAEGAVTVNDHAAKPSQRLRLNDRVVFRQLPVRDVEVVAEALPLDILYEDDDIIVINKPPGQVVHPAAGHTRGTLVNAILHHCPTITGIGGERRPGIVHRLDKDTSGVMVVAKSDFAMRSLVAQFKERTVQKEYIALVHGRISRDRGVIDRPIGRHGADRKRMSSVRMVMRRRAALTEWQVERRIAVRQGKAPALWVTLVRLLPKTGRTHQIRVHMADSGFPLVGDQVYGPRRIDGTGPAAQALSVFPRQALHAEKLTIAMPCDGARKIFHAPLCTDFATLLEYLDAAAKV